ncbi:MAG: hypothetical protein HY689_02095 [Chloroflexi bacterium]|nr:hypothetical protein [Chloroflexota bacterium]
MIPIARLFVRTALAYLLVGTLVGASFLVYKGATGRSIPYVLALEHGHLLFVGFLTMLVMGVALWMFPRPGGTRGGEGRALWSYWLLHLGLLARVIAEPGALWYPGGIWGPLLVFSGLAQGGAVALFVTAVWGRVVSPRAQWEARQARREPDDPQHPSSASDTRLSVTTK